MTAVEALILGIAQGLGEFLPISSSGHLLLLEKFGVGCESMVFNVTVHLGTLLAVLIATFKSWTRLFRRPFDKRVIYIVVATLPTIVIALVFKFFAPTLLDGKLLGAGFVLTACALFASEKLSPPPAKLLNAKNSLLAGIFQGVAVLPGVSRSGATISALRLAGVDKATAADFSFLLSIPAILGSAAFEGAEMALGKVVLDVPAYALAIGAAAAFVTGFASIKLFLRMIKTRSTLPFAAYTFALGIVVTILPLFLHPM